MKFETMLQAACSGMISVEDSRVRVATNVLTELGRLGKSQSWLANQIGVHRSRMSKILDEADPQLINVNTLANLAIALKVSMDYLHRPLMKLKLKRNTAS